MGGEQEIPMLYPRLMNTLKTALRNRGWTYARLGEAIGLSESGVKKVFAGRDGSLERVVQIAAALELSLEDVLAMSDAAPAPWRLSPEQEALFRRDPACWSFLLALKDAGWDPEAAGRGRPPPRVEGWLAALERRGVIHRTEGGRVRPADAAGRPWRAGPGFGDAITAPRQDALLAHARDRIRRKEAHPHPGLTECGYARMALTPETIAELVHALRALTSEFAARSRREAVLRGHDALVTVGLMSIMAPLPVE